MKALPFILTSFILIILLTFSSCGPKKNTQSAPQNENETFERPSRTASTDETSENSQDSSLFEGIYLATFSTLNENVNGKIPGSTTIRKEDEIFVTYLRLFAGGPKAWHQQKIYTGTRCPESNDDTNGDGYIDILEALEVVGKVLIPLDADISSQKSGRSFYPIGDESGSYYYERFTNFNRLLKDLQEEDHDLEDEFAKLAPNESFNLEGKVVMV